MEIIVAIGHILGAILASTLLSFLVMLIAEWEIKRLEKNNAQELSIELGVLVEDLEKEELAPRIFQHSSARFSSELLRNRLSDLCGSIRSFWNWLGLGAQLILLAGVIWFTTTDGLHNAIHAWWILAIMLFFWLSNAVFAFACRVLTGRYPGQAKAARKFMADYLKTQQATTERPES